MQNNFLFLYVVSLELCGKSNYTVFEVSEIVVVCKNQWSLLKLSCDVESS